MKTIKKLVLKNFKRFRTLEIDFDKELNILIGGNETGKSSVLQALDIVMSCSRSKVETLGLEALFNADCIDEYLKKMPQNIADLPEMVIEIYLEGIIAHELDGRNNIKQSETLAPNGIIAHELDGRNNSKAIGHVGIKLVCKPVEEYTADIRKILAENHESFPFEYYDIRFSTFADNSVHPNKKPLNHLLIDSAQINNDYATREYTRSMYVAHATVVQRNRHGFEYRQAKSKFKEEILKDLNEPLQEYQFGVRTSPKASIETDIIITEDDIPIERKGKGRQCFIKTEFALHDREHSLDILLLEEPENHLSHIHMRKLIERIKASSKKQLLIATHSSLISTRLNLKKAIILSEKNTEKPISLKELSGETAEFFMKAPDNNVLELALCKKAILVEGDAEFILIEALYKKHTNDSSLDADGVHVISVGGTSFKRYMELAKLLGIRIAVIRDNDGDHQANCIDNYTEYVSESIRVFADEDNSRYTFEVCMYQDNKAVCDAKFSLRRRTLSVEDYMLKNKADVAFFLLKDCANDLVAPKYFQQAAEWIRL